MKAFSPGDDSESRETDRKKPARQPLYSTGQKSEIIFVTVCTKDKKRILDFDDIHELLIEKWKAAKQWLVGRYVILPDHLHLFCSPGVLDPENVKDWVAYWKSRSASAWPRPGENPIWLRDCWDTQLRKGDSYSAKWAYVRGNPVRHGYVADADEWPYQGELNPLVWRER